MLSYREFCRIIGDFLSTLGILRRLTEYRGREKTAGNRNDGGRIGRGAQYPTGPVTRRWYRFAFRYLWFETYFIATGAWRPRGQRPRMASLHSSVGKTLHDEARGALSGKVGAQDRQRRQWLRGRRFWKTSLSRIWDPGRLPRRPKEMRRPGRISRARTQDDAIRGAYRASHQLGAIRPPRGDSDYCVLPEGSASDTCAVASERGIRRTLWVPGIISEQRAWREDYRDKTNKGCQFPCPGGARNYRCRILCARGTRYCRASNFARYLYLSVSPRDDSL